MTWKKYKDSIFFIMLKKYIVLFMSCSNFNSLDEPSLTTDYNSILLPISFLILFFFFLIIVIGTKYVSLGSVIGAMLYPSSVGGGDKLSMTVLQAFSSPYTSPVSISAWVAKGSNAQFYAALNVPSGLVDGTKYYLRYEATFLLSDNMAI